MKRVRSKSERFRKIQKKESFSLKKLLLFFLFVPAIFLFFTFSFLTSVIPAVASPGINKQINFQGKLVDNNGLNVADSTYAVVFSLYSVSSGGVAIWTESQNVT